MKDFENNKFSNNDSKKIESKKIKNNFFYNNKKIIIFSFLFIITIFIYISFIKYKKIQNLNTDIIHKNIFINNVYVGNLTYDEAIEKLKKNLLNPYKNNKITLTYKDDIYKYTFDEFKPYADIKTAVNFAINYIKEGSIKERYKKIKKLNNKNLKIDVDYKFNLENIAKVLSEIENKYNKAPINATMIKENNNFIVKEGEIGYLVNTNEISKKIYKLLKNKKEGKIEIIIDTILPKYDKNFFDNSKTIIGSFSSKFRLENTGRSENINVASQKINGYILYPEEIFSANKILGSRITKNGYKMAPVLISGELIDDIGGGICQISTNLYMAALFAELEIIERHNHSRKVNYVDYGFDATLCYDYIDLKFKNNTNKALYIESVIKNNISTINIYGEETRNPNRKICFKNELVEIIQPTTTPIYEKDINLLKGETVIKSYAKLGYKYNLYKIIKENGIEISKELINKSYYRPKPPVIKFGIS